MGELAARQQLSKFLLRHDRLIRALQALRGIAFVSAVTLVSELGDLKRFGSARQLMAYLGLVPSEHSTGLTQRRGSITKSGNALSVRR